MHHKPAATLSEEGPGPGKNLGLQVSRDGVWPSSAPTMLDDNRETTYSGLQVLCLSSWQTRHWT